MSAKLDKSLVVVFGAEGGYSDHPADRGGKTNMGITEGALKKAYQQSIVTHNDVKKLTRAEAAKIYEANYWIPCKAEQMQWPLCCLHFDAAVNHGIGGAALQLQRAINAFAPGSVREDSAVGPLTLGALEKALRSTDIKTFGEKLLDVRWEYFESIMRRKPSQEAFRRGWKNRVEKLRMLVKKA